MRSIIDIPTKRRPNRPVRIPGLRWRPIVATGTLALLLTVPAPAQEERNVRARIDRASATSIEVAAGRKHGITERDTVDAFTETSFIGSMRVVDVSENRAELTFIEDPLLASLDAQTSLRAGSFLYLRFDGPADDPSRLRRSRPLPSNVKVDLQFASIYDSNVDHSDEPDQAYGLVPAAKVTLRSSSKNPLFTGAYVIARHNYPDAERWTRTSHMGTIDFEPEPNDWFRPSTSAEISIRGSSEDRDVSNQYRIEQDLEFRLTRDYRLSVYGDLIWKKIPDSPIDDAFKPRVGAAFERRGDDGSQWELDIRREWNEEKEARGEYDRWKIETSYRFPLTKSVLAQAEVEYRRKTYRDRFIEIEEEEFLRKDNRWTLGAFVAKRFRYGVVVEVGYRYETNDSNDPDKLYGAHLVNMTVGYSL